MLVSVKIFCRWQQEEHHPSTYRPMSFLSHWLMLIFIDFTAFKEAEQSVLLRPSELHTPQCLTEHMIIKCLLNEAVGMRDFRFILWNVKPRYSQFINYYQNRLSWGGPTKEIWNLRYRGMEEIILLKQHFPNLEQWPRPPKNQTIIDWGRWS